MRWWNLKGMFVDEDIIEGEKKSAVLRAALAIQLDRLHQQIYELEEQLGEGNDDLYGA